MRLVVFDTRTWRENRISYLNNVVTHNIGNAKPDFDTLCTFRMDMNGIWVSKTYITINFKT